MKAKFRRTCSLGTPSFFAKHREQGKFHNILPVRDAIVLPRHSFYYFMSVNETF